MNQKQPHEMVRGRVIYLLIMIVVMQTIYPITIGDNTAILIGYQLLVAGLVVTGIMLARDTVWQRWVLIGLGGLWVATGIVYTLYPDDTWALLVTYGVLISFHCVVIWAMLNFIFNATDVTRDVLYAASAVYLLIGAVFVSAFGLLETVTFAQTGAHAITDSLVAANEVLPWQNLIYYSYATLTTLGYGDMLPATMWARSMASAEAVVGVLYITIIMARLVGLYAASDVEQHVQQAEQTSL